MNKGIFALGVPLLFILLGVGLFTDANWNLPEGDFTVKNYVGIVVAAFFGILFILALTKLFSGIRKVK